MFDVCTLVTARIATAPAPWPPPPSPRAVTGGPPPCADSIYSLVFAVSCMVRWYHAGTRSVAAIGMRALANAKLRECTKIRCGSFFVAMSTRSVIDPASATLDP